MQAQYTTIFDATLTGALETWSPVLLGAMCLVFSGAIWFKRESMMPNRGEGARVVIGVLFIVASVFWSGLAAWRVGAQNAAIKAAMRDGTVEKTEGFVTSFKPQYGKGDFWERFCVGQKCFYYFEYLPGPGFHTAGRVAPKMQVRIFHAGNTIIRLDIVPLPKRQRGEPAPGGETE
ncbi:MAG: hypothetical protein EPN97_03760 [Alphaproteobacteria bacterium]|nr:MAG: hypothetical protein EPN97_03760 [Alphaproteobacteria bacterium]